MSRSIKHTPISKDWVRTSKQRKTLANRQFRRTAVSEDIINHKSAIHKRYTESWDIHDYVFRWTREDAVSQWYYEEHICHINGWDLNTYGWHRRYKTLSNFLHSGWAKCALYK